MSESLFSPSWYRVANLKPRIRAHARILRQSFRGEVWFVLQDQAAELERLLQAAAAFAHERVVGGDLDAQLLQLHQLGEDVGGAVEQRARVHRALDALARGVLLGLVGAARIVEAFAGDVDAVLDMVEQAPGERLDQPLLGVERVRRRLVGLEPVAVVVDAADAVDDRDRTVGDALFHGHGRPLGG